MDDLGLQRAIFASFQSMRSVVARPQPLAPARQSFTRTREIFPTAPRPALHVSRSQLGTCAREGILPATRLSADGGAEPASPQKERSKPAPRVKPAREETQPTATAPRARGRTGAGVPSTQQSATEGQAPAAPKNEFERRIEEEILAKVPNVKWEDIASLGDAKRLLHEAVILPQVMPNFFTGICSPWRGVLLFGPPGTGKTLLARAVASSQKTTFFSISAASLLSRYHGESEKMVKALFSLARARAPATIFIDEIDAIAGARGASNEHEVSRRVKTELLIELDGMASGGEHIMLLATTNRPWDIDEAMRRRLEKRIYVPLPDAEGRQEMFRLHTSTINIDPDVDFVALAEETDRYSGADIQIVCREVAMMPLRKATAGLTPDQISERSAELEEAAKAPRTMEDFRSALKKVSPSVDQSELGRYQEWSRDFAAT